ncbi:MAG TPA: hypothetical protein VFC78_14410 [Tepidisphaeraceae bacterium]|nr:hypothetical protein [Tepidisphaeraceae bacterium]
MIEWAIKGRNSSNQKVVVAVPAQSFAEARQTAQDGGIHDIRSVLWFQCIACRRISIAAFFGSKSPCHRCRRAEYMRGQQLLSKELYERLWNVMAAWPPASDALHRMIDNAKAKGLRDISTVKVNVYHHFFDALIAKSVPPAQAREVMESARKLLRLHGHDVRSLEHQYERSRLISMISSGHLPTIDLPIPIGLQKNEIPRFYFPKVEFWQERIVGRQYVGMNHGVSVRIARGLYYHVGSSRGHVVSRSRSIRVATGGLALTSKRLIFSGKTAFSIPLPKILHFTAYSDGFQVVRDSTAAASKPFTFICPDADMTCLALSACLNNRA